jgi:hypothetical protein
MHKHGSEYLPGASCQIRSERIRNFPARREFGNPTVIKEQAIDSWRYTFADTLIQDVRYGSCLFLPSWTGIFSIRTS